MLITHSSLPKVLTTHTCNVSRFHIIFYSTFQYSNPSNSSKVKTVVCFPKDSLSYLSKLSDYANNQIRGFYASNSLGEKQTETERERRKRERERENIILIRNLLLPRWTVWRFLKDIQPTGFSKGNWRHLRWILFLVLARKYFYFYYFPVDLHCSVGYVVCFQTVSYKCFYWRLNFDELTNFFNKFLNTRLKLQISRIWVLTWSLEFGCWHDRWRVNVWCNVPIFM